MSQDLLAPPRVTVRKYAILVACISVGAVGVGVWLAVAGVISPRSFAWRTLAVALLAAALIWGYARLLALSRRVRPERMPFIHSGLAMMNLIAAFTALGIMARGSVIGQGVPAVLWMLPFMVGMMLITGGIARRVGESLHCPRCEYEFNYPNPDDAPIRCPECGSGWLGLLKKGRRVKSVRLMVAGAVIATLGFVIGNPTFYIGPLAPHLPTSVLYASVNWSSGGAYKEWDALTARPLSDEWVRAITENVVLERRGRVAYDHGPNGWFETFRNAGKISQDLQDRWFRQGFRADLHTPRTVKTGEPFTVHLRVQHASGGAGGIQMGVMFAGYDLGEGTPRLGRADQTKWAHDLNPQAFERHRDAFPQTLTIERPGQARIRATYWVVYLPSFNDPLVWQPDGTPLPPPPAFWFQRIDVEETVTAE